MGRLYECELRGQGEETGCCRGSSPFRLAGERRGRERDSELQSRTSRPKVVPRWTTVAIYSFQDMLGRWI